MSYGFRPGDLVTIRENYSCSLVYPDNTDKVVGHLRQGEVGIIVHVGTGFPCILLTQDMVLGAASIVKLRRV